MSFSLDVTSRRPEFGSLAPSDGPTRLLDDLITKVNQLTMMQFGTERRNHFLNTVGARARNANVPDTASYIRSVLAPEGQAELMALIDDLAILAYEALRFLPSWDVHVCGTDIASSVIEVAKRGVYPKTRLATMPPQILTRYFDDLGNEIRVKEILRRLTSFQSHNLRDQFPPQTYDVIFCRNVMIYFSREDQVELAKRFKDRLTPEGFLFIGHSESLQGLDVNFQLRVEEGGVAYQKL